VRVFLDTNVLISAFATRGICRELVARVVREHEFQTSEVVIKEVRRVLKRKLKVDDATTDETEAFLRNFHVETRIEKLPDVSINDKSDLDVLGSAVAARAEIFITGDRELLELGKSIRGLEILDPRGFWDRSRLRKR
jgi:putative PIN family toxin of toxin-antitoxin system